MATEKRGDQWAQASNNMTEQTMKKPTKTAANWILVFITPTCALIFSSFQYVERSAVDKGLVLRRENAVDC